ncbi:N/A [soil metagenome]
MRPGDGSGLRNVAAAVTAALLLADCTADGAEEPALPRFREVACPADVEAQLVQSHTCGELTVPADRDRPAEGVARLFVLRVQPPEGTLVDDEPMYVVGNDVAQQGDYVGIAPMAQRIGREVIIMDPRGTGYSEPTLQCPEVEQLDDVSVAAPTAEPDIRRDFLDAVASCADRLRDDGVDPADYGVDSMARDAEDLRAAIGIDSWGLTTFGTYSLVALEIARTSESHVSAVVLDTPVFPGSDPATTALEGTRAGIRQVADACEASRTCSRAYPDLELALVEALRSLRAKPVSLTGSSGRDIVMDDVLFLRLVRQTLSGVDLKAEQLPALVYRALDGRLDRLDPTVVDQLGQATTYCFGYLPKCLAAHELFEGVGYTIACGDMAAATVLDEEDESYHDAFVASPWTDACQVWPVTPSEQPPAKAAIDEPALVFTSRLDPYAPAAAATDALASFEHAWQVDFPTGRHNLLGEECARTVRNAWLADPTSAPTATKCVTAEPLRFEVPGNAR